MTQDYIPYGPQWEKEVNKLSKKLLIQMLRKAHLQRRELAAALEDLMDWQNGPPLVTYEKGWTAAMQKAQALLNSDPNLEGCDATGDASSTTAD